MDLAEHTGALISIISTLIIIVGFFMVTKVNKYDKYGKEIIDVVLAQDEIKFNYIDRFNKLEKLNNDNLQELKDFIGYRFTDMEKRIDNTERKTDGIVKEHEHMRDLCLQVKIKGKE